MAFLKIDDVVKRYGDHLVIDRVSLSAEKGEFVVFVGPSGCGKSTLLRMIAGLEEVSDGDISIDGRVVTHVEPAARQVAMVFQSYALYPHMSVKENMAFGLVMAKTPKPEIEKRVANAARILQIEQLLDRTPRQLSGGQRQRVAIGRAIVRDPKLFLFDEPLSNLDAELRSQMRVEIARLHRDLGVTMVYVTHDQIEAMTLADRIVVLRAGKVEQIGTPTDLYERPANTFVAGFIGSPKMNFLEATVTDGTDHSLTLAHPAFVGGAATIPTHTAPRVAKGGTVRAGLRPEHMALGGAGGGTALSLAGEFAENLGGASQVYAQTPGGDTLTILAPGRHLIDKGMPLTVAIDPARVYLFDDAGRAI
jgi:multiple sugar transport system ATP-binding protein/lactose/L-arabinose transport system ATP-binding protein